MSGLGGLSGWTNLGGIGLLLLIAFYVIAGQGIMPRKWHLDRIADKDAEITRNNAAHAAEMSRVIRERDSWRETALIKDATIAEQARQLGDAWEAGRTAAAVIAALPKVTGR